MCLMDHRVPCTYFKRNGEAAVAGSVRDDAERSASYAVGTLNVGDHTMTKRNGEKE